VGSRDGGLGLQAMDRDLLSSNDAGIKTDGRLT
jgi:hypothetical protein